MASARLDLVRGEGIPPATYLKADQFREDTWASLRGRKFNLVFSDGVHSPNALRRELDFLLAHDLVADAKPFAMVWDDLLNAPMQEAFVDNANRLKQRFSAGRLNLYWMHGSYGNRRLNGVFWVVPA